MATIQISGVRELLQRMDDISKRQAPFAIARALTMTVKDAAVVETSHIGQVFDKPTPFTQRAVGISVATRTNLAASVFIKTAQAKYLEPEAEGGARPLKRFEQKFATEVGQPHVVLPGRGMALNQYGNITRAKIKRIAGDLNSSGGAKRFFAGKPKGQDLPAGVYARTNDNRHITPLLVFANEAQYRKRFKFSELAVETVNERFGVNLATAWAEAMRTARR